MNDNNPYHEYVIVARLQPTETEKNPPAYRMRVFAPNPVVARSRFWYFLGSLKKVKKTKSEILAFHEVKEKDIKARNYGIWFRYASRRGVHNMYKEFRDVSRVGAVHQLYQDMASRHSARAVSVQVIDIKVIENSQVKRANIKQLLDPDLKFPLPHRVTHKSFKCNIDGVFREYRGTTFFD